MRTRRVRIAGHVFFLLAIAIGALLINLLGAINDSQALSYPTVGQASARNTSSISTGSMFVQGNESYFVVCGATDSVTLTVGASGVSSFTTTYLNQAGTPTLFTSTVSILASGTSSFTCSSNTNTSLGMWVYKLNGISGQAVSASSTGTSTTISTGTANASAISPGRVAFLAGVSGGGVSSGGSWSAGAGGPWTYDGEVTTSGGPPGSRLMLVVGSGTAAAGNNSGTIGISSSNSWRGQIVVLQAIPSALLESRLVDSSNNPIGPTSFPMSATTSRFTCQTTTGTLTNSNAKIRAAAGSNYTSGWTLSLGATGGAGATWSNGAGSTYSYNNPAGSGCTAGQLTVNGTGATYQHPCINLGSGVTGFTGISSFSSGSVDSITLMSASPSATRECFRYAYGYALTQQIPPEKRSGSYSLPMTLTMTAL